MVVRGVCACVMLALLGIGEAVLREPPMFCLGEDCADERAGGNSHRNNIIAFERKGRRCPSTHPLEKEAYGEGIKAWEQARDAAAMGATLEQEAVAQEVHAAVIAQETP